MNTVEWEVLMSEGYIEIKKDFKNGICRGWIFLASLHDYAQGQKLLPEVTDQKIQNRIREIDRMIEIRKETVIIDRLTLKNLNQDSTPYDVKRKGALVSLGFEQV
jgi:hypothetical protein